MDKTSKNGEATMLEVEEEIVETPHNHNSNNTETQHECSMDMDMDMDMECTKMNARPVEKQTLDDLPMDISTTEVETPGTEKAIQGFEERTMLEAEGYDLVTPLILYSVDFLFLCDHVAAVWNVLSVFFALLYTLTIGRSQSVMLRHNQKR